MVGKAGAGGLAEKIKAWARKSEHEKTLAACDRAIESDPGMALAHAARSRALWAMNRPEEAAECIDRALGIEPGNATALAVKSVLIGSDRPEEARACYEKAIALDPGNQAAQVAQIAAELKAKRIKEAPGHWENAKKSCPGIADAMGAETSALLDAEAAALAGGGPGGARGGRG